VAKSGLELVIACGSNGCLKDQRSHLTIGHDHAVSSYLPQGLLLEFHGEW
jgi:hypothetical protein